MPVQQQQPTHATRLQTKSGKRATRAIPLHLLESSLQGPVNTKPSRSFHAPALDGSASPFGEAPAISSTLLEQAHESSPCKCRSHSVDTPRAPHTAPHGFRRPLPHRLPQPPLSKLPSLRSAQEKHGLQLPAEALIHDHTELEQEQSTSRERRCQTAPASCHKPALFAPAPPLTAPLASKTPRHRHIRSKAPGASTSDSLRLQTPKEGAETTNTPKEFTKYMVGHNMCPASTKSSQSQSTTCPSELLELQPASPQEASDMDTPTGSFSLSRSDVADLSPQGWDLPFTGQDFTASESGSAATAIRWRKGEKIGTGSHGCVFKAQNTFSGHLFVVKESIIDDIDYETKLRRELEICKDLDHLNIVQCLGHEYVDSHLYVHLEYVPGGSLKSILEEFGPLGQELMPVAMHGLLLGLQYLHTRSPPVVHRDIKSANVLVGQDFCMKLADFGCSKRDYLTTSFTTVGSVLWMAPEVIRGHSGGHGRKADIWSLGCVFIEMATAERPWKSKAFDNVWQAMKYIEGSDETPWIPQHLPDSVQALVSRCLNRAPSQRASASELLLHEVFHTIAGGAGLLDDTGS